MLVWIEDPERDQIRPVTEGNSLQGVIYGYVRRKRDADFFTTSA